MSLTLIVAEKPSVARDLARVLGLGGKGGDHFHGRYRGEEFQVTWAVGHLVGIGEPEVMNPAWKAWDLKCLPILPKDWRLQVTESGQSQFQKLRELFSQRDLKQVICATDSGREGELIFRYIAEAAKLTLPVQRLWISSLTDEAILKGMNELRPQKDFDNLFYSARCRSRADWLVGMNFTRFYTLGAGKLFSVGRVQTPTLALIAKRTEEIESFSSKSYYEIGATFTHEELPGYYLGCLKEILSFPNGFKNMAMPEDARSSSHEDSPKDSFNNSSKDSGKDKKSCYKFSDLPNCQIIEADLSNSTATLTSFDTKLKLFPPPELFDLTELQREANKRFHFTADKTLKVAQSLYERHKVISYPRTDSRHLTEDVAKDFVGRMAKMSQAFPDLGFEFKHLGLRYVDSSKVTDHHAMIPVGKASSLSGDEQRIYDLILMRSLQIFLPSRRVNESRILTDVKGGEGQYVFHSQSSEEIHPGWTGLEKHFLNLKSVSTRHSKSSAASSAAAEKKSGEKEDQKFEIPSWVANGVPVRGEYRLESKQTSPPKPYTDASLLSAMEYCGRTVEDQALKEALKSSGIGTPATRAQTIELLIGRKYVERKGKGLFVTPIGRELIHLVHPSLKSVELTGSFEKGLELVRQGKVQSGEFEDKIQLMITRILPSAGGGPVPPYNSGHNPISKNQGVHSSSDRQNVIPSTAKSDFSAQSDQKAKVGRLASRAAFPSAREEDMSPTPPKKPSTFKPSTGMPSVASSGGDSTGSAGGSFKEANRGKNLLDSNDDSASKTRTFQESRMGGSFPVRSSFPGSMSEQAPLNILKKVFGLGEFRSGQEDVISALVAGRDALVLMPTGGGKSLCFQIPGLARPGVALVISPLLALMDDQVRRLRLHGIAAFALHSGLSREAQSDLWRKLEDGEVKFLFVSPEKMANVQARRRILAIELALVAIDEAHCVSQWGHDFRPDYREFSGWIREVRPAPVIALTATATQKVSLDIAKVLDLNQPLIHVGGFYRHNLAIEVQDVPKADRIFVAQKILKEKKNLPAIVYVSSRKDTELFSSFLGKTVRSGAYHAGMTAESRKKVQADFIESQLDVVVATVAFGMGIDKSNIRTVIHMSLPSSVESYYQEIGRAGRDGDNSRCLLLKSSEDREVLDWMYRENYPSIAVLEKSLKALSKTSNEDKSRHAFLDKLLIHGAVYKSSDGDLEVTSSQTWKTSYLKQAEVRMEQIRAIESFAGIGSTCRMLKLTAYFGQTDLAPCQICDVCTGMVGSASPRGQDLGFHIMDYLRRYGRTAFGKLKGELAKGHKLAHSAFESILQGMASEGFLTIDEEMFVSGGKKIHYRSVAAGPNAGRFDAENPPLIPKQSYTSLSYQGFGAKKGKKRSFRSKQSASSLMVKRVVKGSRKPKKG